MTAEEYRTHDAKKQIEDQTKHAVNILRGEASRESGKLFEEMVTAACNYYAAQGIARIEKTPEPMKPIKRLEVNRFIAVYEKKAQPDFKGTLRHGQSIVFECKHTGAERIEQSAITLAQAAALQAHHDLGAMCFVLVSIGAQRFFLIPWSQWTSMKTWAGRKSLTVADMESHAVPSGPCRTESGTQVGVLFLHGGMREWL